MVSGKLPEASQIKAIVTDLDGTLLNSKGEISTKTKQVIHRILKEYPDVYFVLASGRGWPAVQFIRKQLGLDECSQARFILLNGCLVYNSEGKIIYEEVLPTSVIQFNHELSKKYPNINYAYSSGDDAIMFDEAAAKFTAEKYQEKTCVADKDELLGKVVSGELKINKICFLTPNPGDTEEIIKNFTPIKEKYNLEFAHSTQIFLEYMPEKTNKGTALDHLISILGITKDQVIAFGDGGNDLELLQASGHAVAMANSYENLKEVADIMAKTNDEDGEADILERIFFKNEMN